MIRVLINYRLATCKTLFIRQPCNRSLATPSAKHPPNVIQRIVLMYYSSFAIKCTTFAFGIGGILMFDGIQQSQHKNQEPVMENLTQRLLIDAFGGFMFWLGGFYVHMYLPFFLAAVPVVLLLPDSSSENNTNNKMK